MPTLYIVRGLPGSGKSTFAKKLAEKLVYAEHWENDKFLYEDGKYVWTKQRLNRAMELCVRETSDALWSGLDVIVSNVFMTWYALEDYMDLAQRVGAKVVIIEASGTYGSIHNLPEEAMVRFRKHYWSNEKMMKFHSELEYQDVKNIEFKKVEDYAEHATVEGVRREEPSAGVEARVS